MTQESLKRANQILKEIEELKTLKRRFEKDRGIETVGIYRYKNDEKSPQTELFSIAEIPELEKFLQSVIKRIVENILSLEKEFNEL